MDYPNTINAFPEGNSLVSYNKQLDRLLIGNAIGVLKLVNTDKPDLEPTSIDIIENFTSISSLANVLLVTNTAGNLELIDLESGETKGSIYRSELPLRDAVFINDGKRVVCGGDDDKLVVLNLQDSNSVTTIKLPQLITNLSYKSESDLLAVSLSNGDVQIYSVINEQLGLRETLRAVVPQKAHSSMDEIDYVSEHKNELLSTRCQWTQHLFIPSFESIKVYNTEWKLSHEIKFGKDHPIVDFKLDPTGTFVAALFKDLSLCIAEVGGNVISDIQLTTKPDQIFTNVLWDNSHIYVGSTGGEVHAVKGPKADDTSGNVEDEGSNTDALLDNSEAEPNGINRNGIDDSIIDEDDSSDDEIFGARGASLRERHDDILSNKRQRTNDGSAVYAPVQQSEVLPYSPGSTPFTKNSSAERRYLTMNTTGYVVAVKSDEMDNLQQSITVSFFDRSINKDYHFADYHTFDLCSISANGVLLANSNYKNSKPYGLVYYRSHSNEQESWDKKIPLHKGEYLTSICLTDDDDDSVVVVGTSFGYLRFYNKHGLCRSIIKTNPILTVMSSTTGLVFYVTQLANNLYAYSVLNINDNYRYIQQDNLLPLKGDGKNPLIKGVFFSEFNDPCIVAGNDDTLVILSSWRESGNAKWVPILDCKQAITENDNESKKNWKCWPLGLLNDKLNCLLLKTNDQYPGFPLPMPIELQIKLPINYIEPNQDINEDDFEECAVKSLTMGQIANDTGNDQDYQEFNDEIEDKINFYTNLFDKSLLKLFADTCKEGQISKSLSIAKLMKNDKALIAATKICQRFEYNNLATKIGKLRENLVDVDEF